MRNFYDRWQDNEDDFQDFLTLMFRIYKATSPIIFWCMVGGAIVGLFVAVYVVVEYWNQPVAPGTKGQGGVVAFILFGIIVVGAIFGFTYGVLIEFIRYLIRGPRTKRRTDKHKESLVHDREQVTLWSLYR